MLTIGGCQSQLDKLDSDSLDSETLPNSTGTDSSGNGGDAGQAPSSASSNSDSDEETSPASADDESADQADDDVPDAGVAQEAMGDAGAVPNEATSDAGPADDSTVTDDLDESETDSADSDDQTTDEEDNGDPDTGAEDSSEDDATTASGGAGGASAGGQAAGGAAAGGSASGGGAGAGGTAEPTGLRLLGSDPPPGADDIDPMMDLMLTFSNDVTALSGNIQVLRADDDALFDEIAVDDPRVEIDGASITIDLEGILASGTEYYVTIDADIVEETAGNAYPGIDDPDELSFTTLSEVPAEVDPALVVWFDADYSKGLTTVSGAVSVWGDRSGNNFHAVQTAATERPRLQAGALGTRDVVRFDGSNDWLQSAVLPNLEEYEIVVVWQSGSGTLDEHAKILSRGANLEINYGHPDTEFQYSGAAVFGSDWYGTQFEVPELDTAYLWIASFSATTLTLSAYTNGTLTSSNDLMETTALEDTNALAIGSNDSGQFQFEGDVAEVMIYDGPLSDNERDDIAAYVEGKWSIALSP